MPVPDTSVLAALFDADHPRHTEARRLVGAPGVLHVSGGVVAELTTLLRRRANDVGLDGNRVAREALEQLEKLGGFRLATDYDTEAASRLYRDNAALSYVDAWGIALAVGLGEELLTLDERQRKAYQEARQ